MKFFILFFLMASSLLAESRKESIKGVELLSYKNDDVRIYRAEMTRTIDGNLAKVRSGIVNFDQKCNNNYVSKRKIIDKDRKCIYHNENLVETEIRYELPKNFVPEPLEENRYILIRQVYNRGSYTHYDLVQEFRTENEQKQPVLKIKITMLKENEVKNYLDKLVVPSNPAFDHTTSQFTLTEISPQQTEVKYEYEASTDHWILSKDLVVSQVFDSLVKNFNELWETIAAEATKNQIRQAVSL